MPSTPLSSVSPRPQARHGSGADSSYMSLEKDGGFTMSTTPDFGSVPLVLSARETSSTPSKKRGESYGPKNVQACDRCRRRVSSRFLVYNSYIVYTAKLNLSGPASPSRHIGVGADGRKQSVCPEIKIAINVKHASRRNWHVLSNSH